MSTYYDLAKLGRVKLPSTTEYALIDVDGRAIITENFSAAASYSTGDLVIGAGLFTEPNKQFNDCLLKAKTNILPGAFDNTQWEVVTIASELHRLENAISGGVHYIGKTTTQLFEGSTTATVSIGGAPHTAVAGDMVIFDRANGSTTYTTNTAYNANTYIKDVSSLLWPKYYVTNAAITAGENTSIDAIAEKLDKVPNDPEFLFDGTTWNLIGTIDGLGDLAFKDSVTGAYEEVRSATVTVSVPSPVLGNMGQTTIIGVGGTENVSKMTAGTALDIAKAGTAVRYGTADVGTPVRYGTADRAATPTIYGTANVGTEIEVGTSLTGTTEFNTNAIRTAVLTGTTQFNTDAIKSATISGTDGVVAAKTGIVTSVSGDCLQFSTVGTTTLSVATTAASKSTVGIETTPASTAKVGLGTTPITPAISAPSTQTIYGAVSAPENQKIAPAVAAPNNQTIVPAVANGSITPWTETAKTVATSAANSTLVGTGTVELHGTGSQVLTSLGSKTETKTVTLNKQPSPIVSK